MVLDINYLIVCKEYTKRDAKQKKNQLQVTRIKKKQIIIWVIPCKKNYVILLKPKKSKKKSNPVFTKEEE